MDRREFSAEAARLILGGAVISIAGCGGGAGPTASEPVLTDVTGTVGDNHGHTAVITAAELKAGGAIELAIQGTSSHPHTVSLSASDVQSIRAGARVERESSGSKHTHVVIFNA